jgi:hypothetical protein
MSLSALYNGITFGIGTNIIKLCAVYPTQEFIKGKMVNTSLSQCLQNSLSGLISGVVLSLVTTPINTIKVPLMISAKSNVRSTVKYIYNTHGLKGFGRGGIGTLIRDITWNTIYFPLFAFLNDRLNNKFGSSIIAGSCAMCISYPFDGIRMFRQNNKNNYNFWYGFKYSFNRSSENLKSFGVCMIRVPLSVASSHYMYLKCNDLFIKK